MGLVVILGKKNLFIYSIIKKLSPTLSNYSNSEHALRVTQTISHNIQLNLVLMRKEWGALKKFNKTA